MKSKIALLFAVLLPVIASASATSFSMRVPTKGLAISASATTPSSAGGATAPTVPAAPNPAVPSLSAQGEISYGGLTIARVGNSPITYTAALAACAGTLNNKTGWRLVSQAEFNTLVVGAGTSMFTAAGYDMTVTGWLWNSDVYRNGSHLVSRPVDNRSSWANDTGDVELAACVRSS